MASVIRGSGASTLGGNVDVQGVLTYEDVTSVDSVGIVTARNGIRIPSGSLGIGTEIPANTFQLGDSNSSNVIIAPNLGVDINDGALNLYQATDNVNATPFIISTDVGSGTENEKLRFTAGGKLGIGTDNPSELLHLESGWTKQILKSTNLNTASSLIFDTKNVNTADFLLGQLAGRWNGNDVAYINFEAGSDTANDDDGVITFLTSASSSSPTEKLRIHPGGEVSIGLDTAPGLGELVSITKKITGNEGAGVRMSGQYTMADDETKNFSVGNACLVFIAENNTGDGALFFCGYKSSTVTLIADPNSRYSNADTDGRVCLYKSANSVTVTLKNRVGSSKSFTIGKINTSD